ncbi:tetratricopeptide repeat protein [Neobacillus pocheonensis]|uniref:Tetratricopeptide repeat protein n=1 Tax=Neobacillus pocheonensis TaxID=363869 RepID=A0ABT0W914_9BACI|nr:tetratricopeptide repeat protein [Neobacillus pocheonensis]
MKKREKIQSIDNIIFFPGLEKRLADKGLESLQKKKYAEAINLLEEARELDADNGDILIGLVLAYFEAASFQKAKDLANEMLLKGIGDYFQMVDLYLTILIQLNEYPEIVATIEALLEEKEIPLDKHDHFLTILQFSRRMAEHNQPEFNEELPEESITNKLNLFSIDNLNQQMLVIANLAEKNVRPYLPEIEDYLIAKEGHPFLKTMLLTLLKEQEYDRELVVNKFNNQLNVIPTELPEINLQPRMKEIEELVGNRLENSNPVLLENIIGMVEQIFFISYPFDLQPENTHAWAAAFHLLAHDYLGIDPEMDKISSEYQVSSEKIELAMAKIREIEEISYPNI